MVDYNNLSALGSNVGIDNLMAFPNSIYPYYWVWILGAIWFIISLTLYFREKADKGAGNFLSAMSVSGLSTLLLSVVGTLLGIISLNIMIYIFVFVITIIVIWIFSKDN